VIYQIDCWKWEEILAGAYKQAGWEIVTLTPKRGDKGIDVIAERRGWGQLRFLLLDQMKAYKPEHLIGPEEIREMGGGLFANPNASTALITTTSDFTPGAIEAAAGLAPRIQLRPRGDLIAWLASILVEGLRTENTASGAGDRRQPEGL
jgi:restriction system protein